MVLIILLIFDYSVLYFLAMLKLYSLSLCRKSSAKSVKSMVSRPGKEGISASLSNPLLHYKSQSNKLKHGSDKRKGAKKLGVDSDPSSTLSPPYSHKVMSSHTR